MANPPKIFGQYPNATTVIPHALNGQPGWWQVPPSFNVRPHPDATNCWECSPNADFSPPLYIASMDYDGTMVFQDMMADRITKNGEQ